MGNGGNIGTDEQKKKLNKRKEGVVVMHNDGAVNAGYKSLLKTLQPKERGRWIIQK